MCRNYRILSVLLVWSMLDGESFLRFLSDTKLFMAELCELVTYASQWVTPTAHLGPKRKCIGNISEVTVRKQDSKSTRRTGRSIWSLGYKEKPIFLKENLICFHKNHRIKRWWWERWERCTIAMVTGLGRVGDITQWGTGLCKMNWYHG